MKKVMAVLAVTALWLAPQPASARGKGFAKLPAQKGKQTKLEIRMMGYKNGKLVAQIRNKSRRPQTFDPQGLFFVPNGNPDKAPQRMGAAGPFEVLESGTWKAKRRMKVASGKRFKVRLHLFCLDSHRSSPSNGQAFAVARKRLPKRLQTRIAKGTRRIFAAEGAYARPSAKSAAQSHIWRVRNSKWIRLQGERRKEKSSSRQRYRQIRRIRRYRIHRNPHLKQPSRTTK